MRPLRHRSRDLLGGRRTPGVRASLVEARAPPDMIGWAQGGYAESGRPIDMAGCGLSRQRPGGSRAVRVARFAALATVLALLPLACSSPARPATRAMSPDRPGASRATAAVTPLATAASDAGLGRAPDGIPSAVAGSHGPQPAERPVVLNFMGDATYPDALALPKLAQERPLRLLGPILESADFNVVNFECAVSRKGPSPEVRPQPVFPLCCQPAALDLLLDAGVSVVSLANNHALDGGVDGVSQTLQALSQARERGRRVWWAGLGRTPEEMEQPARVAGTDNGVDISFFSVSLGFGPMVARLYDPGLTERVRAEAARGVTVIVMAHSGDEFAVAPNGKDVRRFHQLVDAGATLVVGHHPHILQGVERYGRGVILYSLGNISFDTPTFRNGRAGVMMQSVLARVTLARQQVIEVELVPLYVDHWTPWGIGSQVLEPLRATPQLLAGAFAAATLDVLAHRTALVPGGSPTHLTRVGDRAYVDLGGPAPGKDEVQVRLSRQGPEYAVVAELGLGPKPRHGGRRRR